tara:strand:- start:648 stop:827 length:180 start_codon:yes stop_codon:yes gene_type:complete
MVKLKYNGRNETFFHFDGKKYKTDKYVVDVPDDAADFILTNTRWSKVSYAKKKKKTKED